MTEMTVSCSLRKWDEAKFEGNVSKYFEEFGMNIKLENKAYHPEDVVFCPISQ